MKYLRTSDLAKAVGVHPNTVRRYVDWGLLPPVEHSPSGYRHLGLVQSECAQADIAADLLERWAFGPPADATIQPLQIGQVAHLLGVTIDILRNWDRNGLIDVPRDPSNGYRRYVAQEISSLCV